MKKEWAAAIIILSIFAAIVLVYNFASYGALLQPGIDDYQQNGWLVCDCPSIGIYGAPKKVTSCVDEKGSFEKKCSCEYDVGKGFLALFKKKKSVSEPGKCILNTCIPDDSVGKEKAEPILCEGACGANKKADRFECCYGGYCGCCLS